ncbi:MAG: RDD family protein [Pyrinomonadaceae bacterium]
MITLSVCPSCGTMLGDSVREELAQKVRTTLKAQSTSKRSEETAVHKPANQIVLNPPPAPIKTFEPGRTPTSEIKAKETNRTLVEFQSKDGTIPEWRTQIKNAVRQRGLQKDTLGSNFGEVSQFDSRIDDEDFFGKIEIIEEKEPEPADRALLLSALKRIDISRNRYLVKETTVTVKPVDRSVANAAAAAKAPAPIEEDVEIVTVREIPPPVNYDPRVDLYVTSELNPEFVPAKISSSFGKIEAKETFEAETRSEIWREEFAEIPEIAETAAVEIEQTEETAVEETISIESTPAVADDRAPFTFRFNAGVFDLLTSSFASLVLLAPFMLLGGNWFTVSGVFAFLATMSIVTFIYLTTTIGMFGKSFGMHLFSLEMIDAGGEEYPTIHQAAVSSSIYLLSLVFLGLGFITCFFDEDGRSIYDIVSNTIVVREPQPDSES